jgi:hypothetical protein
MDAKDSMNIQTNGSKDEEMPFSSPKRRLLEAKEKDAYFEKEVP